MNAQLKQPSLKTGEMALPPHQMANASAQVAELKVQGHINQNMAQSLEVILYTHF